MWVSEKISGTSVTIVLRWTLCAQLSDLGCRTLEATATGVPRRSKKHIYGGWVPRNHRFWSVFSSINHLFSSIFGVSIVMGVCPKWLEVVTNMKNQTTTCLYPLLSIGRMGFVGSRDFALPAQYPLWQIGWTWAKIDSWTQEHQETSGANVANPAVALQCRPSHPLSRYLRADLQSWVDRPQIFPCHSGSSCVKTRFFTFPASTD